MSDSAGGENSPPPSPPASVRGRGGKNGFPAPDRNIEKQQVLTILTAIGHRLNGSFSRKKIPLSGAAGTVLKFKAIFEFIEDLGADECGHQLSICESSVLELLDQ